MREVLQQFLVAFSLNASSSCGIDVENATHFIEHFQRNGEFRTNIAPKRQP